MHSEAQEGADTCLPTEASSQPARSVLTWDSLADSRLGAWEKVTYTAQPQGVPFAVTRREGGGFQRPPLSEGVLGPLVLSGAPEKQTKLPNRSH